MAVCHEAAEVLYYALLPARVKRTLRFRPSLRTQKSVQHKARKQPEECVADEIFPGETGVTGLLLRTGRNVRCHISRLRLLPESFMMWRARSSS